MKKRISIINVIIGLVIITNNCFSFSSSTFSTESSIGFIGNLNNDSRAETVIFKSIKNISFLPVAISWGSEDIELDSGLTTSSTFSTEIIYPNWDVLYGSCMFKDFNNDSISDILFYIYGKVIPPQQSEPVDTFKMICIFGQNNLSNLETIYLDSIVQNQYDPFFARLLLPDNGLINPQVRDRSGKLSYVIDEMVLDTTPPPKIKGITMLNNENKKLVPSIKVFPNPADESVTVQMSNITLNSSYKISLYNINGVLFNEKYIAIENHSESEVVLNLDSYPIGYYFIIILDENLKNCYFPLSIYR